MGIIKKTSEYLKSYSTRGFRVGFVAGLFYFSYIFWWFWSIYPLETLGLQNKTAAGIVIFIVFLLCVLIMALWWGLFGFFAERFWKKNIPLAWLAPVIAGTFTLAEYCRSVFFSIFWYGNGGMIGPYWPVGNIAYLLIDLKWVSQTASIWGIYGITFSVILSLSTAIILIIKDHKNKIIFIELVLGLVSFPVLYLLSNHLYSKTEKLAPVNIALIQTDISYTDYFSTEKLLEDFQKKAELLEKAADQIKEGIIIFPEGTNFTKTLAQFLNQDGIIKYFKNLSGKELLVMDSVRVTEENGNFRSESVFISTLNGVVGVHDKQILTPAGEFLPYIIKIPLSVLGPTLRQQFKSYLEYEPGDDSGIIEYKNYRISSLICSELISPSKAREENADFILNMGSFSFWHGSPRATGQALTMGRFRAIENGKYYAFASNSGYSYIVNPDGNIEKMTSPNSYELLTGSIIPNKGRTWYNYVGDWPILLVSSVFFALGTRKIRNEFKG